MQAEHFRAHKRSTAVPQQGWPEVGVVQEDKGTGIFRQGRGRSPGASPARQKRETAGEKAPKGRPEGSLGGVYLQGTWER